MNAPQLPPRAGRERGACMHHTDIIRDQDIPLLEIEIQTHAAIVQHLADQFLVMLFAVADADFVGAELRLPLVPGFVPADARFLGRGVRHHEREVGHVVGPVGTVLAVPF